MGIAGQLHDLGFRIVATRGTAAAIKRMGIPVETLNKIQDGSPHVRRLDRARRRRPRDQHADRHRRALGRLRDPPRGGRPRRSRASRRSPAGWRRRARSRAARVGEPPVLSLQELHANGRATHEPAARSHAGLGRRLAEVREYRRARRLRHRSPATTRTARRPTRAVLHARPRPSGWGGGDGERPFLPRAFSVMRRRERPAASSCSRTSGRARMRLCELRAGDGLWLAGPFGIGFAPPRDGRRPLLVGGGRRHSRRWRSGSERDAGAAAGRAVALLGFRDAAHARGAGLLRAARASPPTTARSGTAGRSPTCCSRELGRDAHAEVYACGPPAMLEAVRAICAERRRPRPARARVRHGVRLRRLLRLRRADAAPATCACASTARCSTPPTSSASDATETFLDLEPIRSSTRQARLTRSPLAVRSVTRCCDRFPFAAFVTKTVTLAPRQGNPPPRLYELPAGLLNSIGLPNKGLEASSPRTCRSSRGCPSR